MNDEQQQMLEDCAARVGKLTEWEANFVNDLLSRPPANLSKKQDERLNEIWDRVTK
jgi:hypothetical protein